jgi:hypothetical protein
VVAQPDRVGRTAYVTRVNEFDACAESVIVLGTATTTMPRARLSILNEDTFELTPEGAAYLGCEGGVFEHGTCVQATGAVRFERRDLMALSHLPRECGEVTFAYWDGTLRLLP